MFRSVILLFTALWACSAAADGQVLEEVTSLRLAGKLGQAQALCEQALPDAQSPREAALLHLELARIYDRFGLHTNTRPVADALRHIEAAASVTNQGDQLSKARIELAYADYFYRAEMPGREFPTAIDHAHRASEMFNTLGDWHGAAEAVHKLGLIRMQQGNYEQARELFDESLALDVKGGERTFFLGEYERHVGFVLRFSGDMEGAIPYFERSLRARRDAGAIDASLFAAVSLASTLIETGRAAEAERHLEYALNIANQIDSGYGEAITLLAFGQFHRDLGQADEARAAFNKTVEAARSIGSASIERRATEALAALQDSQ